MAGAHGFACAVQRWALWRAAHQPPQCHSFARQAYRKTGRPRSTLNAFSLYVGAHKPFIFHFPLQHVMPTQHGAKQLLKRGLFAYIVRACCMHSYAKIVAR